MTSREIIFPEDSVSIIKDIVKKRNLVIKNTNEKDLVALEILSRGEIAQAVRDIVNQRCSLQDYSSKFQKIFNISQNEANALIKELDDTLISIAAKIGFNEGEKPESEKPFNVSNIKNKKLTDNQNLDSYREPIK